MKKEKLAHVVTFRLTDAQWIQLQLAAQSALVRPNDWARDLTIQSLAKEVGMTPNDRRLFEEFVRTHYLVANGFQLLADDKLNPNEWKKVRLFARDNIDLISSRALADLANNNSSQTD